MKASLLYRIAAVLLLLFAVGHTLGFRNIDPAWNVDPLIHSMQSAHFVAQGFTRTYWDFYVGFGFFVSILLILAALLAWHLGSLPPAILASMKAPAWALSLCFVAVTFLSWKYFFLLPVVFSATISLFLVAAAWVATNPGSAEATTRERSQSRV